MIFYHSVETPAHFFLIYQKYFSANSQASPH